MTHYRVWVLKGGGGMNEWECPIICNMPSVTCVPIFLARGIQILVWVGGSQEICTIRYQNVFQI